MRKVLLAILVLPLLVYGGIKAYLWYQVRQELNRVVDLAAPFATIEYGGIFSSLQGRVGVREISIEPHGAARRIALATMEFRAPNLWLLIQGERQLERGSVPERLGVSLRGFTLPVDDSLLRNVDQLARTQGNINSAERTTCGGVERVGARELRAMGYDELTFDVDVGYDLFPSKHALTVRCDFTGEDMFAMSLDASFSLGTSSAELVNASQINPQISGLTLIYRDDSYTQRKNRFCAEKSGTSVRRYVNAEVEHTAKIAENLGYRLSDGILSAYRSFRNAPGELLVTANPVEPIGAAALAGLTPDEVIARLNLAVQINQKPFSDLHIAVIEAPTALSDETSPVPKSEGERVLVHRYRETTRQELPQHIGRKIRILTSRGKEFDGKLVRIKDDGDLKVEKRTRGGSIVFEVPKSDIRQLYVLLYGEP
jgi:hypothetical protein